MAELNCLFTPDCHCCCMVLCHGASGITSFLWKKQVMVVPQKLFHACLILYTVGLLILLFIRPDSGGNSYNLVPFYTISYYFSGQVSPIIAVYNLAANIGLFIPYGIFLKSRAASMRKTFAYSVFVSQQWKSHNLQQTGAALIWMISF
ncbi:VanZ family protein [Bacillus sp. OVS6]|nr:VanZ family protein [Bacillus sp. OVS6]